jgi:hypothetical protein
VKTFAAIFALSLAMLLGSGCASVHPQPARHELPPACVAACKRLNLTPTKYIFTVNIAAQRASLFEDGKFVKTVECSTSRFGIGEELNSFCTPRGLHRIAEKAGDGYPAGTIFSERKAVGSVENLGVSSAGITTRIMWLDGLEPGYNRGTNSAGINVDTHDREVYIHGTGDQNSLGKPASHGCIHLSDPDLIAFYNLLPSGTLVWISEK